MLRSNFMLKGIQSKNKKNTASYTYFCILFRGKKYYWAHRIVFFIKAVHMSKLQGIQNSAARLVYILNSEV